MEPTDSEKTFSLQPSDLKMWQQSRTTGIAPACDCLNPQYGNGRFGALSLHSEIQDTDCEAWKILEDLIENAASRRKEEFAPGLEMSPELWTQIIVLPTSISKLTAVRKLYLYGSHLVRIPPEIGRMENLEELDLYTSYRLHWVPFEVTRCVRLKRSRFSTRALYGNYKYRPPFPRLGGQPTNSNASPISCSVCGGNCSPESVVRVWISLRVATDVLPLLVTACSNNCVRNLPSPAPGYVDRPHTGGTSLAQPPKGHLPPRS